MPYHSASPVLNLKIIPYTLIMQEIKELDSGIRFRADMKQGMQRNGFHNATIPVKGC
jgi:hypothetical protein